VAVITREACAGATADAREGGGPADFSARVSLPDGETRVGCCRVEPVARPAEPSPAASPVATVPSAAAPQSVTEPRAPAPAPAAPPASAAISSPGGEITTLVLADGRTCSRTDKWGTTTFKGQRLHFDCGLWGGDTVGMVGALTAGPEGFLGAQKAVIAWRESEAAARPIETTSAKASEVRLADALTCRAAGTGATPAFEGRRVTYTCGVKDGETVALLGDLEPVEGGFRIVRGRIGHSETGFVLRSSDAILVTAPR
jgi:hypothetical protein